MPLPGGAGPVRHKSKVHHTEGFATRDEAVSHIRDSLIPRVKVIAIGRLTLKLADDIDWHDDDVPALSFCFDHPYEDS